MICETWFLVSSCPSDEGQLSIEPTFEALLHPISLWCPQGGYANFWTIFRIFVSGSKFEPYSCGCCYFQILVSLAGQILGFAQCPPNFWQASPQPRGQSWELSAKNFMLILEIWARNELGRRAELWMSPGPPLKFARGPWLLWQRLTQNQYPVVEIWLGRT